MDEAHLGAGCLSCLLCLQVRYFRVVGEIIDLPERLFFQRVTTLDILSLNFKLASDSEFALSEGL